MLNVSLCYFIAVVTVCTFARFLLARQRKRWLFLVEFIAAFGLAACRLEVQTISEIGQWAGGLGADVTLTMLFLAIIVHGAIMQGVTGNPSMSLMGLLQKEAGVVYTILSIAGQFAGAHLALLLASWYWKMELIDMHMIKNMMLAECTSSLNASLIQGTIVEVVGALAYYLAVLSLHRRSQLLQIPLLSLLLTFLYYVGSGYTCSYLNPSLAYALTFTCPGHTFLAYAVVYWLGPFIGMTLALFLYRGNIPLLFTKNLLYSRKGRFRSPKGKNTEEKKK